MDSMGNLWLIAAFIMTAIILVLFVTRLLRNREGRSKYAPTGDPAVDAAHGIRSSPSTGPATTPPIVTPSTNITPSSRASAPAERWNPETGTWEPTGPQAPGAAPQGGTDPLSPEPYTPDGTEYVVPTPSVTDRGAVADARRFELTEIPPDIPGEREYILRDDETGSRVEVATVFERGRITKMVVRPKYLGQNVEFALFEAVSALLPDVRTWAWPPMTGSGRDALVTYARSHPEHTFTDYDGNRLA